MLTDARALAVGAVMCAGLVASEARAQESTAIDRFDPAPAGDAFSMVPSAAVVGRLRPAFALGVGYARGPLVLRDTSRSTLREIVGHHVAGYVQASLALFERGLFEVTLPSTLHQSGGAVTPLTSAFAAPPSAALGDLRMSGRVELVEQAGLLPSLALSGSLRFPTGDRAGYASTGNVRFTPRVTASADYGPVLFAIGAFRSFEPTETSRGNLVRDEVGVEGAVAGRFRFLELGAEAVLTSEVGPATPYPTRSSLRFEPLASARAHAGPVVFSLLGGPGVARSPGTPAFRLYGSVGVAFDALPRKRASSDDETTPRDDGAPREIARSPKPGSRVAPPLEMSPDRDHDGVPDVADACPDRAGVAQPSRAKNGCPIDSDGDGFYDTDDACPREPGVDSPDPKRRGCSDAVHVETGRILVLEKVQFATGKADLLPESDRILEAIRKALESDPTIVRVAVDGHTDARGAAASNLELSRARAVSVVRWLTTRGVDARRLTARGFGSRRPLVPEHTDDDRAKNRRVELVILKRDPRGASAWTDGDVDEGTDAR